MSEDMNLSINGQSQVPPGFRFHPTEEELLHYYLRKKVAFEKIDLDVIREVDLNKLEPWDIQEKCKIGSTPQNDWYFFSHKDKKYPTGTRTNRATAAGFWKATGRDKIIYSGFRRIGLRKTLVFYKGRAPHGQKSDWIMHEYRLDESSGNDSMVSNPIATDSSAEDGWVVCRVFKKKNYQKSLDSPKSISISNMDLHNPNLHHHHHQMPCTRNDGVLDQILLYMGRTCKLENDQTLTSINNIKNNSTNNNDEHDLHERFMLLPRLESPTFNPIPINNNNNNTCAFNQPHDRSSFKPLHGYSSMDDLLLETDPQNDETPENNNKPSRKLNDWVALDRLVASQLNGQDPNASTSSFCSPSPDVDDVVVELSSTYNSYVRSSTTKQSHGDYEADFWSNFAARASSSPSSSDPLCHLSV